MSTPETPEDFFEQHSTKQSSNPGQSAKQHNANGQAYAGRADDSMIYEDIEYAGFEPDHESSPRWNARKDNQSETKGETGAKTFAVDDTEPFSVSKFAGLPPSRRWLVPDWIPINYVS